MHCQLSLRYCGILFAAIALLMFAELRSAISQVTVIISGPVTIVDGDTLELGAVRVRLHGIDAPEAGQRCGEVNGRGSWACGTAATNRLAELVERAPVHCRVRDRDLYSRIVAVCFAGDININTALVEDGYAWAYRRYSDEYVEHEARARAAGRGIWQGQAQAAWDYRASRWALAGSSAPRSDCPIKGNINRKGERIYHTPWSPWYDRTRIDESKGQRWFCNEGEAEAAGWRPARWR